MHRLVHPVWNKCSIIPMISNYLYYKSRRSVLLIVFTLLRASILYAGVPESSKVFYGGFAFAGNASETSTNYPVAVSLDETAGPTTHFFETQCRDFIRKNAQGFKGVRDRKSVV